MEHILFHELNYVKVVQCYIHVIYPLSVLHCLFNKIIVLSFMIVDFVVMGTTTVIVPVCSLSFSLCVCVVRVSAHLLILMEEVRDACLFSATMFAYLLENLKMSLDAP